jgi:hypothetical protein
MVGYRRRGDHLGGWHDTHVAGTRHRLASITFWTEAYRPNFSGLFLTAH